MCKKPQNAKEDLANTQIIAPFDGVIASVIGQVGGNSEGASSENQEGVTTGGLLSLIDDSQLVLEAQVDETNIVKIKLDQKAEVIVDALADQIFPGKIVTIAPLARVVSNIPIYDVIIVLDNAKQLLRAGMTAEAEIVIREVASSITVPNRVVQKQGEDNFILVKNSEGDFKPHSVKIIDIVGFNAILETELPPNSIILETPSKSATEGSPRGGPPPGAFLTRPRR